MRPQKHRHERKKRFLAPLSVAERRRVAFRVAKAMDRALHSWAHTILFDKATLASRIFRCLVTVERSGRGFVLALAELEIDQLTGELLHTRPIGAIHVRPSGFFDSYLVGWQATRIVDVVHAAWQGIKALPANSVSEDAEPRG